MSRRLVTILALTFIFAAAAGREAAAQTFAGFQCNSDDWVYFNVYTTVSCDTTVSNFYASPELEDLNGGDLEDGDTVRLVADNFADFTYVSVGLYGGAPLDTWHSLVSPGNSEAFVIENMDCDSCEIVDGSRVSMQSVSLSKYWSAASCGGAAVNGTATSRGTCEVFEIKIY